VAVKNGSVPELSRFFGIIKDGVGIFSIDPVEMIAGSLPTLSADWERLQEGRRPAPIEPLR
jgi:hypothetical protein